MNDAPLLDDEKALEAAIAAATPRDITRAMRHCAFWLDPRAVGWSHSFYQRELSKRIRLETWTRKSHVCSSVCRRIMERGPRREEMLRRMERLERESDAAHAAMLAEKERCSLANWRDAENAAAAREKAVQEAVIDARAQLSRPSETKP